MDSNTDFDYLSNDSDRDQQPATSNQECDPWPGCGEMQIGGGTDAELFSIRNGTWRLHQHQYLRLHAAMAWHGNCFSLPASTVH